MLPKYTFADITVFMKTENGEYLNITDYRILEEDNEKMHFNSNSRFVIMFCSFFYNSYKTQGQKPYICDITLKELENLAGIHDKSFLKRLNTSVDNDNEDLIAVLCARRILDYRYGKAVRADGNIYAFYRQCSYKVNGKNRKKKSLVFEKQFYEA